MSPDPKSDDLAPPYSLVLSGQSVLLSEAAISTSLYQINRDITSISQTGSTVTFERVENDAAETDIEDISPSKPRKRHLFYLAHPANARYRTDIPAQYYITSASPEMVGNIRFETSKPRFQRTEFKAMLSAKKTALAAPLFDEEAQQLLFSIRPRWKAGSGGYRWTDSDGRQVAFEGRRDDTCKLSITSVMPMEMRDALVALWLLKVWHDSAESKQAKREGELC